MATRMRTAATLPTESDSDAPALTPRSREQDDAVPGRVRLLVSARLLGENVRYDGRHKYDAFLVEMRAFTSRSAMAPCAH